MSPAWATHALAPALLSFPSRRRICFGASRAACGRWAGCRARWSGIARPASMPAAAGRRRSSRRSAASCKIGWRFCAPARPAGQGRRRAAAGLLGDQLRARPAASPTSATTRASSTAGSVKADRRARRWQAQPVDRLDRRARGHAAPAAFPDLDRRWVAQVPPTRSCASILDYSLDPRLASRRVEVRLAAKIPAVWLDRRTRRPSRPGVREPPNDRRDRARPRAARAARRGRGAGRSRRGRWPSIPADRMSTTAELAHLFRALKAPAAARALPKLADRARAEEWSYERFAQALLSTEHASTRGARRRGSHQGRPLPRPQDARGVRLHLPTLGQEDPDPAPRPARLPRTARRTSSCSARPAPARPTWRSRSGSAPAWPATASRSAPPPNGSRCSPTPNATAASTTSSPGCSGSRC